MAPPLFLILMVEVLSGFRILPVKTEPSFKNKESAEDICPLRQTETRSKLKSIRYLDILLVTRRAHLCLILISVSVSFSAWTYFQRICRNFFVHFSVLININRQKNSSSERFFTGYIFSNDIKCSSVIRRSSYYW